VDSHTCNIDESKTNQTQEDDNGEETRKSRLNTRLKENNEATQHPQPQRRAGLDERVDCITKFLTMPPNSQRRATEALGIPQGEAEKRGLAT